MSVAPAASTMTDIAGQTVRVGDTVAIAEADYDLPPAQRLVTVQGIREVAPAGNAAPYWVIEYTHEDHTLTASSGQIVRVNPIHVRTEAAPTTRPRLNSRSVRHIREDLAASLDLVLGEDGTSRAQRASAEAIVDGVTNYWDGEEALRKVIEVFGPSAYGTVLRFHIEAETSLSNTAEVLSSRSRLAALSLTVADLAWPREVLHGSFLDQAAPTNPAREASMQDAVDRWKRTHAEPVASAASDPSLA